MFDFLLVNHLRSFNNKDYYLLVCRVRQWNRSQGVTWMRHVPGRNGDDGGGGLHKQWSKR